MPISALIFIDYNPLLALFYFHLSHMDFRKPFLITVIQLCIQSIGKKKLQKFKIKYQFNNNFARTFSIATTLEPTNPSFSETIIK